MDLLLFDVSWRIKPLFLFSSLQKPPILCLYCSNLAVKESSPQTVSCCWLDSRPICLILLPRLPEIRRSTP
jgi:hypothetical protein